jgi:sugar lactone lactonase YvrE
MKQNVVVPVAAVVAALLLGGLIARAAEQPAQPYPPGTILTVAGNGKGGFSGDGGPATLAALNNPQDLSVDGAGSLFIADGSNGRIRKVSPDGIIMTIVGTGQPGASREGAPALQARIGFPNSAPVDAAGNRFITDCGNDRVWKMDPAGIVTTVAHLACPQQLAVDPMGNLYTAELFAHRIRKVDPAGKVTTVTGSGHPADGRGDGGLAVDARLYTPEGVALDHGGSLYISDFPDGRVRRISPDGKIITVAGGGQPADGVGDGGMATDARLDGPSYIVLDHGGNLFIAENRGERIRKVSPAGIISTVAGNGQIGRTGDGGPAVDAPLNSPESVAVDRAGNLYFTEGDRYKPAGDPPERKGNNLVREVTGVAVPG